MKYPYLVASDKIEYISHVDILVIPNFDKAREKLKKRIRAGIGLEMQLSSVRAMDAKAAALWFAQVRELYRFSKLARCQLLISSCATMPYEMVSGRSFDALLEECGISPEKYWTDLERWLKLRLGRRVVV